MTRHLLLSPDRRTKGSTSNVLFFTVWAGAKSLNQVLEKMKGKVVVSFHVVWMGLSWCEATGLDVDQVLHVIGSFC